ncbi:MAG: type II secretion system F family protein [Candidatus Margulisiibacteriota bacterium]
MFSVFSRIFQHKISGRIPEPIRYTVFPKRIDLPFFCEQLASMLSTGHTLPEILPGLETTLGPDILHGLTAIVNRGKGLEKALCAFPKCFPQDLVRLVAIGEQTGFLEQVLIDYAAQYRKRNSLIKKVKKALFYPALIMAAGVLLIIYTVVMVLPSFQTIFSDMDIKLPAATAIMLSVSGLLREHLLVIIAGLSGLALLARMVLNSGPSKEILAALFWKLRFIKLFWMSNIFQPLGMFLNVGIPLESALNIVKELITHPVFHRKWRRVSKLCCQGHAFHHAAKMCGLPNDTCSLLKTMENSGRLAEGLHKCAEYQQAEMENFLDNASSLLEPLAILIVGGMVGLIVFSLFSPLMSLTQNMM